MSKKQGREYWYDYVDINLMLIEKSNQGDDYKVMEAVSQDNLHTLQRVNEAFTLLEVNPSLSSVVIPINLGYISHGVYTGSHWVGLVLKRDLARDTIKAFYSDSLGTPIDNLLPSLKQILENHEVNDIIDLSCQQQHNGYDCGPWTVFNLDNIARSGKLPIAIQEKDIIDQRNYLNVTQNSLSIKITSETDYHLWSSLAVTNITVKQTDYHDKNPLGQPKKSEINDGLVLSHGTHQMSSTGSGEDIVSGLNAKINHLSLGQKPSPKFVVNPIIYVDGIESDDSSDESYDSSDEETFDFDLNDPKSYPFRTYKISNDKKQKDDSPKQVGFVSKKRILSIPEVSDPVELDSQTVDPFLKKLRAKGLETSSEETIEDTVSVSLCLNRPLSLSTRKNNVLKKELAADTKSKFSIEHFKFGIYWEFKWYNKDNKEVDYKEVQTFYKKLKKYDLTKAEEFRKIIERGITVPYQELRELAKNHENTKKLVRAAKEKSPACDIYLSFVDGDTVSFNGVYSAYLRIHNKEQITPTVMSTGYAFTKEQEGDHAFVEGCELDRQIRIATAKYFPQGTYYPEPNFCVRLSDGAETVEESFIDKKRGNGTNLESPILLTNILQARGETIWVFEDDNPLLTRIPIRVRKTKNKKADIKFSEEFQLREGQPTEKDVRQFDQMSQSKTDPLKFAEALYYNKGFKLHGNNRSFNKIVKKLIECDTAEESEYVENLRAFIPDNVKFKQVISSILATKKVKQDYFEDNVRTPDMQALYNFMKSIGKEVSSYDKEFLCIIANDDVLNYLKEKILDIDELARLTLSFLRDVLYNDEIIDLLRNSTVSLSDIEKLYDADILNDVIKMTNSSGNDILDIITLLDKGVSLDDIKEAQSNDYDISEILLRYEENPLHLRFMTGDPTEIVLSESDNSTIVQFGIANYDIDIEWVREELDGDSDGASASLMDFDLYTGKYEDDDMDIVQDKDIVGSHFDYE